MQAVTTNAPVTEGSIPFLYDGETYQTYCKVFGNLAKRTNTPLVVLHGGPGLSHDYLLPLSDMTDADIPIVFYDQIGNSRSTHLKSNPRAFWTIDLFIDELENVLKHFDIQDDFSLLGHSWGGIIASEFEVRRQPTGLKRLVITNSPAEASLWVQSNAMLALSFPKEVQEGLAAGMQNPRAYQAALKKFHGRHGCTIQPFPKELAYSLDRVFGDDGDPTVASAGILDNWSIIERLHMVRVPTFVANGRKDIAQDFVVAPFFQRIRQVKWVTFEQSSHTPFWEEREHYNRLVVEFLKSQS
ncbi:hypothetical protein GSI_13784 [Ganoderma sinense ZZ0214-1]|uniref:AB hydrolase-1 domain-containing protein n=1 Tax=Ganoderma sinense ZZ0214-1 TaxID=1077348 RepID=A0A2G8RRA7_9APHY|nr:hypothetical protein GSI_13784 [Ganoderma sinense ZZ0214-1]